MISGVLLDMDGTLCDTETVWRDVSFAVADELGVELVPETYLAVVGLPGPLARPRLAELVSDDFPLDEWLRITEERAHALCDEGVPLKAGALELIDTLEELGLGAVVCTSSTPAAVERHLGDSGILTRLHGVVAQGSYALGKPHPEPYLTAAALLGVPPGSCLAVEDSENGVRSAATAGCLTVLVPDLSPLAPDVRNLCAHVLDDLHAVADLVRNLAASAQRDS